MDREKSINNGLEIIKFIKQNRKAIQETYGRSSIEKPSTKERTREWEDFFNSHYQGDLGQKGLLQESQDIGQERAPEFPTSFDGGDAHDRSGTQRTLDWDSAGDRLLLDTMVANPLINDGRRENTDIRDADKEVQSRSNIRNRDGDRVPSSSSHGVTFPCSSRALTNDEGRSSALDGKNVMELNTKDKMQRGENDSSSTVGTGGDLLSGDKDLIAKLSKISERVTSSRGSDTDTCDEDDGLILIGGLTPKEIDNLIEESNNSEIESRGQPYHNKGSLQGMNKENQGIIADQTGAHTQPNNSQQKGGQATTGNSRENGKAVAYSHQEGDLKPKGQVTSIINEEQGYRTDSVKDDFVKIDVTEYTKPKPKLPRKPVRQIRKSEQSGNPNAIGSIEIESTTSDPFEISMRQFKKGINETTTSSGTGSLSPSTDGAHLTAEKTDPQLQTSTASADDALLSAQNVSSD
ncbi:MAG: V protein [Angavokely henipavirus]|nr:MAG: V protein [Angavokely henipavirus]